MRRSCLLLVLLLLSPLATVAASPPPPGQLMMVDRAGDANGVNPYTHGVSPTPRDVPTGPAQVAAADILAGSLATRWSGRGDSRRLEGIDVRLRTADISSTVPLEYATYLVVDGCFVAVMASVGRGPENVVGSPPVWLWFGDAPECGAARGRSYEGGELTRSWDRRRSELVVSIGTRRGPRAVRAVLRPGATVQWSGTTSTGPAPSRIVGALDLAFGGEETWVIGR